MSELLWVLTSEKGASFGDYGVSGSYILPKSDANFELEFSAGRRLWIVLRGHEDRLLLAIKIKKVERIVEGYHYGDYWISPDTTNSVKFNSDYLRAVRYATTATRAYALGVTELLQETSDLLALLVRGSIQTKLLPPDQSRLSQIHFDLLPSNDRRLAKSALRAIVTHLTLEQVWVNGSGDRLGAFSNFARALLAKQIGIPLTPGIVDYLKNFDPAEMIFSEERHAKVREESSGGYNAPCVDTEFSEIEPKKIYAREYVSSDSTLRGFEGAIKKTEHAERVHQEMLRDISEYLITKGITPYESSSIDLLYMSNQKLCVFEIKSSNAENILSQSSKGAFQLACYLNELSKDYPDLDGRLVLHVTESPKLQNYIAEVLLRFGIKVLFYDPGRNWPYRIVDLPL